MRFPVLLCLSVTIAVVFGAAIHGSRQSASTPVESPMYFDMLVENYASDDVIMKLMSASSKAVAPGLCPYQGIYLDPWNKFVNHFTNGTIDWTQSGQVFVLIRRLLASGNYSAYQHVCHARDRFYTEIGQAMYYTCVNFFSLMQYTDNPQAAASFVRLFQHLDFYCNVAYQLIEDQRSYLCTTSLALDDTCYTNFNSQVNYADICTSVDVLTSCQQQYINQQCGPVASYYSCEDARVAYGYFCPHLRCIVPSP